MSLPLTSHLANLPSVTLTNGVKRSYMFDEMKYEDPSYVGLPSNDTNAWYYPSHGYESEEESHVQFTAARGNWGRKTIRDARWVRKGKMAPWGPAVEEWDVEERARKRIKLLLPPEPNPDAPVTLPHLRSPSPPLTAPYPIPAPQHYSYTSFVLDKSVIHTYRSRLLDELEQSTNNLIQGEATLKRALGRLWQVISEDPAKSSLREGVVPKREDEDTDTEGDKARNFAHEAIPATHKHFLSGPPIQNGSTYDSASLAQADAQLDQLEKSLAVLRELQDDGREYVERLEEIREGLGDARQQRNAVWDLVRERAIKELQEAATSMASAP